MLYIGIDLGTSSVKLVCMNEYGTIVQTVSHEYPLHFPQSGWAEQDPLDWWNAVKEGCKEIVQNQDALEITGISFGGQMHGLVTLDQNDEVIRPAILWNDGRSDKECAYLNEVIGQENLSSYCANIAFTGFTAPKILWMKKHESEKYKQIKKIMLPKDYIQYRFSGKFATDVSDASGTLLFDVENKCWSKEMLDICGISENQLPNIYESYEVVGTILPAVAKELGLSKTTSIIAGAGDNAAAAIGTGTIEHGDCNISLGTSGTVFIASKTFGVDNQNALHSFAHANGYYHRMGCMLSAASCNKWWMNEILKTNEYVKEQENLTLDGSNSVFFLPYLMGERSPHNDSYARGAFINMTMDTTRENMTQAILEGVCFAIRDSIEIAKNSGIDIQKSKICGGGTKSEYWCQLMANILGIKIEIPIMEEGPGYGAAILAAVGCGAFENVANACRKLTGVKKVMYPQLESVNHYEKRYRQFKKLYPALKQIFYELQK